MNGLRLLCVRLSATIATYDPRCGAAAIEAPLEYGLDLSIGQVICAETPVFRSAIPEARSRNCTGKQGSASNRASGASVSSATLHSLPRLGMRLSPARLAAANIECNQIYGAFNVTQKASSHRR
jgi:hypothetical protein